jgi:hypothetical protein
MIVFAYRGGEGPPIHFIVPTGYRGPIWVIEDRVNCQPLAISERGYIMRIPGSGVLKVRSLVPFTRWHSLTAAFSDGAPLATDYGLRDNQLGLRCGGYVNAPRADYLSYFVGDGLAAREFFSESLLDTEPPETAGDEGK